MPDTWWGLNGWLILLMVGMGFVVWIYERWRRPKRRKLTPEQEWERFKDEAW